MRTKQVIATVFLDTRRAKENGTYPIKLRLTHRGQRDYFPLGDEYDCDTETWATVEKTKGGSKRIWGIRHKRDEAEAKAAEILKRFDAAERPFTFDAFRKAYMTDTDPATFRKQKDSVITAIEDYAKALKEDGRISSGQSYDSLSASLQKFLGYQTSGPVRRSGKKITFAEVTPEFLTHYQKWMEKNGGRKGTGQRAAGIGIYMRNLRAVVNVALTKKQITPEDYPFHTRKDDKKYSIPTGGNVKKALPIEQVRALRDYPLPDDSSITRYRDLWYLSYLCNGMNVKDICLLKWSDIDGDVMHFIRAKTSRTVKQIKPIRVILPDLAQSIIARWGNPDTRPTAYVFPFIKADSTPLQVRYITQNVTKSINESIRQVASEIGITAPITSYWARHSWATQLMKENAPVKHIQDGLGHTSLAMTSRYTDELDESEHRKYSATLI